MAEPTPAGWYPAPHANNEIRYWDGVGWQDQAATPPSAPSVSTATLPGAPDGAGSAAPQGFAIAALIVGIVAFLTGLVPWLGFLAALAAVLLAILALRKKQRRGFAVVGLVLGSIALLTGLIVTIVFTVAASNPSATSGSEKLAGAPVAPSSSSTAQPAEATPEAPKTPSTEPVPEVTQAAPQTQAPSPAPEKVQPAADLGEAANPFPQPYVAKGFLGGEKYSLTGSIVDANASALVKEWNQFNSDAPAGFKYVVVQLTMTGIDKDGVEPSLAAFDLSLATAEGNRYDNEFVVLGDGMSSMSDGPKLYPGSSFTGITVYVVPNAAQSFLLYDNGNFVAI